MDIMDDECYPQTGQYEVLRFSDSDSNGSWLDDSPIPPQEEARDLAAALVTEGATQELTKVEAVEALQRMSPGDIVSNQYWPDIQQCLAVALKDPDAVVSDGVLHLCAKLFHSAAAEQTADIYIDVLAHVHHHMLLMDQFPMVPSTSDQAFHQLLMKFRIVWKMAHDLPLYWLAFPLDTLQEIFQQTFALLVIQFPVMSTSATDPLPTSADDDAAHRVNTSFADSHQLPSELHMVVHGSPLSAPITYLALLDPTAVWLQGWCKQAASRRMLFTALQESGLLTHVVELCCHHSLPQLLRYHLLHHGHSLLLQLFIDKSATPSCAHSDTAGHQHIGSLLVLHGMAILGQGLMFVEGRVVLAALARRMAEKDATTKVESWDMDAIVETFCLHLISVFFNVSAARLRKKDGGKASASSFNDGGSHRQQVLQAYPNPFAPQSLHRLASIIHETLWGLTQHLHHNSMLLTHHHLRILLQPIQALVHKGALKTLTTPSNLPSSSLRTVLYIYHLMTRLAQSPQGRTLLSSTSSLHPADLPVQHITQEEEATDSLKHHPFSPKAHSSPLLRPLLYFAVQVISQDAAVIIPPKLFQSIIAFIRTTCRHTQFALPFHHCDLYITLAHQCDVPSEPPELLLLDTLVECAFTAVGFRFLNGVLVTRENALHHCIQRLMARLLTYSENTTECLLMSTFASSQHTLRPLFQCYLECVGNDIKKVLQSLCEDWDLTSEGPQQPHHVIQRRLMQLLSLVFQSPFAANLLHNTPDAMQLLNTVVTFVFSEEASVHSPAAVAACLDFLQTLALPLPTAMFLVSQYDMKHRIQSAISSLGLPSGLSPGTNIMDAVTVAWHGLLQFLTVKQVPDDPFGHCEKAVVSPPPALAKETDSPDTGDCVVAIPSLSSNLTDFDLSHHSVVLHHLQGAYSAVWVASSAGMPQSSFHQFCAQVLTAALPHLSLPPPLFLQTPSSSSDDNVCILLSQMVLLTSGLHLDMDTDVMMKHMAIFSAMDPPNWHVLAAVLQLVFCCKEPGDREQTTEPSYEGHSIDAIRSIVWRWTTSSCPAVLDVPSFDPQNHLMTVSTLVQIIVDIEYPTTHGALIRAGISIPMVVTTWLNQQFMGVVGWTEVIHSVIIPVLFGADYTVYFCVLLLNHLVSRLRGCLDLGELLRPKVAEGFISSQYADILHSLHHKYHDLYLTYLSSV